MPRHIVDLGCSTGGGKFALLKRFPEARVTAVDASIVHLRRLRDTRPDRRHGPSRPGRGLARPRRPGPDLGIGLAAPHGQPGQTLGRLHDLLALGGLPLVFELAGVPKLLPDDAPESHVEQHHHDARIPHRGADWGPKLTAAGFTVEGERTVTVHIEQSAAVERHAWAALRRSLDHETLERTLQRELVMRTERAVWAARKEIA